MCVPTDYYQVVILVSTAQITRYFVVTVDVADFQNFSGNCTLALLRGVQGESVIVLLDLTISYGIPNKVVQNSHF